MRIRKAVIPAAGLGTRFLPATKAQPKEMLPLVDKPMIQYVVEEAVSAGIEDILIITGRGKRAIEDHFDRAADLEQRLEQDGKVEMAAELRGIADLAYIHFVRQPAPLGLGHAIWMARHHIGGEPFVVLLGDEVFTGPTPCIRELVQKWEDAGATGAMVAVHPVPQVETHKYGVVQPLSSNGRLHRVCRLVEKPEPEAAPSNLAIVGRYVLPAAIFGMLEALPPGKNGEIQLTDAIERLVGFMPVWAYEVEATRHDVGDKLGYLKASIELALQRPDLAPALTEYLADLLSRRKQEAGVA